MRYVTETRRVGEFLGPIDWEHKAIKDARPEDVERLRKLEASPDDYFATTDSGWPRFGYHRVLWVGMYDGWPYWRPHPTVCLDGPLGAEKHPFDHVTDVCPVKQEEPTP